MEMKQVTGILKKILNKKTGKKEWALLSRSKPHKVLKWFGPRKPSKEEFLKEERRVQYWKHVKGMAVVSRPQVRRILDAARVLQEVMAGTKHEKQVKLVLKLLDRLLDEFQQETEDPATKAKILRQAKILLRALDKLPRRPSLSIYAEKPNDKTLTVTLSYGANDVYHLGFIKDVDEQYTPHYDLAKYPKFVKKFAPHVKKMLLKLKRKQADLAKPENKKWVFPVEYLRNELINAIKLYIHS